MPVLGPTFKGKTYEPPERLGDLQRKILLWVSKQSGYWPVTDEEGGALSASIADDLRAQKNEHFAERFGADRAARAAKMAEDNPFFVTGELLENLSMGVRDVGWSAEAFLGRPPTRSESASIRAALVRLKQRRLINLVSKGTAKRVTHVRLLLFGSIYCRWYLEQWLDHLVKHAPDVPAEDL